MAEDMKDNPVEKTNHVVKRAVTWEISDSEADSDVELWKTTSADGSLLPAAIWDCAGKEKHVGMGKSSEGLSLDSVSQEASSPLSPKKRRKKRSPEEMEADRAKLEVRKLERELKKEERMIRQKQSALEKQRQKEAATALKLLRPDQCMKRLTVCVDPGLLKDPGSDALLEALGSLECKFCLEPQADPSTITWRRNVSSNADEPPEKEVLLLLEPRDFLKHLFSLLQSTSPAGQWSTPDLSQLLPSNGPGNRSGQVYDVVVIGLEPFQWYSWHHGEALNPGPEEQNGNRRSQPGPELFMTQQQMEEALVILQLWGNAGVLFLETWLDLAQHISAMTKAIARRPYNLLKRAVPPDLWHPAPNMIDEHSHYEVLQILDSRLHHGVLQYLVSWKHFPLGDIEWVPAHHVRASRLVRAFHAAYPLKPGLGGGG